MNAVDGLKQGDVAISASVKPDMVDLFLFSAAAWMSHRTHFDKDFAISEGHAGVLVHAPLQGAYIIERLYDWARDRGAVLKSVSWRHVLPIIVDTDLTISGVVGDILERTPDHVIVEVVVTIDRTTGERCTIARARVAFPV